MGLGRQNCWVFIRAQSQQGFSQKSNGRAMDPSLIFQLLGISLRFIVCAMHRKYFVKMYCMTTLWDASVNTNNWFKVLCPTRSYQGKSRSQHEANIHTSYSWLCTRVSAHSCSEQHLHVTVQLINGIYKNLYLSAASYFSEKWITMMKMTLWQKQHFK